jgi:hypothetical protein
MPTELHFAIHTFALQLLFQSTERLIDVVVANDDLDNGELSAVSALALYGYLRRKPSGQTAE